MFTWSGLAGNGDWTDERNYSEPGRPSAGDVVVIPEGLSARLSASDTGSWSLVSQLKGVAPQGTTGKIVIDAGNDVEVDLPVAITADETGLQALGVIEKTGGGTVHLTRNAGAYDYLVGEISVLEGMLSLRKRTADIRLMTVRIAGGAVFNAPHSTATVNALLGTGTVDNQSDYEFRIVGGSLESPNVVEAKLGTLLYYNSTGYNRILRNDNLTYYFSVYGDGVTELADIGLRGGEGPTATGQSYVLSYYNGLGGCFRYIGETDTVTEKAIRIVNGVNGGPVYGTFDAGPRGGITFRGAWDVSAQAWGDPSCLAQFSLVGSNAVPCRIEGLVGVPNNDYGFRQALGLRKDGSGTWCLANDANTFSAGIAVDRGVLRYTSLLERGDVCALGTAQDGKEPTHGPYAAAADVDYSIRMGVPGGTAYPDGGLATLDSCGARDVVCSTRPIALAGDARLENTGSGRFRFAGVSAISEGLSRLVLSGDSDAAADEVADVTDGAAGCRVGIVKEGSGTWVLAGASDFSGPLVVKGGKLVIRQPSDHYTWYRLTVKDNYGTLGECVGYDYFMLGRIGLFDAGGRRQNLNLTYRRGQAPAALEPGEAGWSVPNRYGWKVPGDDSDANGVSALFKSGGCYEDSCLWFLRSSCAMDGARDKWVSIDMRLTNGTPEIAYYDLAFVNSENSDFMRNCTLKSWMLQGSVDGWHWDLLHEVSDVRAGGEEQKMRLPSSVYFWSAHGSDTWHDPDLFNTDALQGIAPRPQSRPELSLADVEYVTVSDGAVLECDGDLTLSRFRASAATGVAGVVKGFRLADSCVIDIPDMPKGVSDIAVPIEFVGASPAGRTWTVAENGVASTRLVARTVGNQLHVLERKGMMVIVR